MSLKNINHNLRSESGFTIVELLIVVVVIAILAAITIVSYNGITGRANASGAQSTAASVQKKVEIYVADSTVGNYPTTYGALTTAGNSWTTPASVFVASNGAPTAAVGSNSIQYWVCGRTATAGTAPTSIATMAPVTGARIAYWDYSAATPAPTYVNLGLAPTSNTGGTVSVGGTAYNATCINPTT